jgi:predicted nucleic acid-binding protein
MRVALVHEYEGVASRPAVAARCPLTAREREQVVDAFLSVCEWVRIAFLWRPNLPDEADNHLIELAVAGGASAVVTNNLRDLRRGLVFPGLRILTPARLVQGLEGSP